MPKDKSINEQDQLEQWLDDMNAGTQVPQLSDKQWRHRAETASHIRHQADVVGELDVPEWDRSGAIKSASGSNIQRRWWHWHGLPALSMAFSFMALSMVIFKVEFVVKPEGVMVSFAGNRAQEQEKRLAEVVDQRLQKFASEQQVLLANYTSDLKVKQQESNLQLANYLLTTSRQERKEDMTDFLQYFSQQRQEEQLTQRIKFNQIEQTLSYQGDLLNSVELQTRPVNWIEEDTTDE